MNQEKLEVVKQEMTRVNIVGAPLSRSVRARWMTRQRKAPRRQAPSSQMPLQLGKSRLPPRTPLLLNIPCCPLASPRLPSLILQRPRLLGAGSLLRNPPKSYLLACKPLHGLLRNPVILLQSKCFICEDVNLFRTSSLHQKKKKSERQHSRNQRTKLDWNG